MTPGESNFFTYVVRLPQTYLGMLESHEPAENDESGSEYESGQRVYLLKNNVQSCIGTSRGADLRPLFE